MDIFLDFLRSISWEILIKTSLRIVLILLFAWFAMAVLRKLIHKLEIHLIQKSREEGEPPSEYEKRIGTIIRLIRQAALIALWLTFGLVLLKEFGIEIGPIIASAGIVGLAVGFGAQNLVRDCISGFFIILENQIRVGDVAIVNGTGGLVEEINFRTIVLRDLGGVVHIFPNGTVDTLSNMTNEWSAYIFDIGVAYKENTDRVVEVIDRIGRGMLEDEVYGPLMLELPEIFGVDKFADSAVIIKGRIKTKPIRQWQVGREFLRRIKLAFDEYNIEIPFPHRTLYVGEESKPLDLQILEKFRPADSAEKTN
ncbi:MAG: mechanosensitive ion channel family protein [Desulfobulbaceae bacterium]|nr:mechanosensitive ion channel family protein [Desulfobulbaceae bacterium]